MTAGPIAGSASGHDDASGAGGVGLVWRRGDVILDLYEVLEVVEGGGMGLVYRVRHRGWGMDLAVKAPRAELVASAAQLRDFEAEAEAWVRLGLHSHTVSCAYVRRLGGVPRVFAEWVDGGSLADWVHDRRLYDGGPRAALPRILDIAIQFAWGLDHAHAQGLIHQDVKPSNVMLTRDGVVKVTDFGLARARAAAGESVLPGVSLWASCGGMTQAYCSPEQAVSAGHPGGRLTRATDVWSWALSVLEMFMGRRPCDFGQAGAEALAAFVDGGRPDPQIPTIPAGLVSLLGQCLAADQADRPATMSEIADALIDAHRQSFAAPYPRARPEAASLLADGLSNQALSMLDLGHVERAERLWEQAHRTDPHNPHVVYNRGLHQWRAARITDQQLILELENVRVSQPEDSSVAYLLASVHLERADNAAARELLREAAARLPDDPDIGTAVGQAARQAPSCLMQTLTGHTDKIWAVALSADGHVALSGGADGFVRVWDLASGRQLRALQSSDAPVGGVALSADGRLALSGGVDCTVSVWELASGLLLTKLEGHSDTINALRTSTDGRLSLSGCRDGTARVWELATGRCLQILEGHGSAIASIALSDDGRVALSGSDDQTVRVWDPQTGACLHTLSGHDGGVYGVAVTRDGRLALSGSTDTRLRLWDVRTGELLRTLEGHTGSVESAAITADGRRAVSGGYDRTLRLWDLESGRCMRTLDGHTGSVRDIVLSADDRCAVSGSFDGTIRVWELADGSRSPWSHTRPQTVAELAGGVAEVRTRLQAATQLIANGAFSAAADELRAARRVPGHARRADLLESWRRAARAGRRTRLRDAWHAHQLTGHASKVWWVALSADGRLALSASDRDSNVRVWDPQAGRLLRTTQEETWSGALRDDGRVAVLGRPDGTVLVWDPHTCDEISTFKAHEEGVTALALSADGARGVSAAADGLVVRAWELDTGRCLATLEGHTRPVRSVALSADGRLALSASLDDTVRVWDLESTRCVQTLSAHTGGVMSVALSADSRVALSGALDGTLRVWEPRTGRLLRTLEAHHDWIWSVALTADGRVALSGGADKTVRVWDVDTGSCLRTLGGPALVVDTVALSAAGHRALAGSWDTTVRVWELDWDHEFPAAVEWDEGARSHLETFVAQHRRADGRSSWTEEDFGRLLDVLGDAGFGWLNPGGVRAELKRMTHRGLLTSLRWGRA